MFPSQAPDREALRRALHSSLHDVLLEVAYDAQQLRPLVNTASNHHQRIAQMESAVNNGRSFDNRFVSTHSQSSLAQSLGFQSIAGPGNASTPTMLPARSTAFNSDDLLLSAAAAAAETRLLDQARAAIFQQRMIEQENKRALFAASYFPMMVNDMAGKNFGMKSNIPKDLFASTNSLLPQSKPIPTAVSPQPKNTSALEALGSSLRNKTDPYIDVSEMADPDPEDSTLRRTRGGVSEPFPEKLHRMLRETEEEGKSDVLSFFSHGRAFGVHDPERFVSEIMPKYFKQSKWNSFARQLNLYGFIRITSGPDAGGYYHELFLKGRPNLCFHMRRVGVPQGEDRRKFKAKNNSVEPDFYSMKAVVDSSS